MVTSHKSRNNNIGALRFVSVSDARCSLTVARFDRQRSLLTGYHYVIVNHTVVNKVLAERMVDNSGRYAWLVKVETPFPEGNSAKLIFVYIFNVTGIA